MNYYLFETEQYFHSITLEGSQKKVPYLSITTKPNPNHADAKAETAQYTNFKIILGQTTYENYRKKLDLINARKNQIERSTAHNNKIICTLAQTLKTETNPKIIAQCQNEITAAEQRNEQLAKELAIDNPIRIAASDQALLEILNYASNGIMSHELRLLTKHPYFQGKIKNVNKDLLGHAERNEILRQLLQNDPDATIHPCSLNDKDLQALYAQVQRDKEKTYNDTQTQSLPSSQSSLFSTPPDMKSGSQDTVLLSGTDVELTGPKEKLHAQTTSDKAEKLPAEANPKAGAKRKRDEKVAASASAATVAARSTATAKPKPPAPQPATKRQKTGSSATAAARHIKSPLHTQPASASASASGSDHSNTRATAVATTSQLKRR